MPGAIELAALRALLEEVVESRAMGVGGHRILNLQRQRQRIAALQRRHLRRAARADRFNVGYPPLRARAAISSHSLEQKGRLDRPLNRFLMFFGLPHKGQFFRKASFS